MAKTWLITGTSRGFGRELAKAVLAAGDNLVATARKTSSLDDLVQKYGSQILPFTLDVTDVAQSKAAVAAAVDTFGRLRRRERFGNRLAGSGGRRQRRHGGGFQLGPE